VTGGATAVLEGWRASTVEVDIRFEPESDPLLHALPKIKEELQSGELTRPSGAVRGLRRELGE
jgi:hypothetical protein